jgi:hypothetical protein
MSESYWWCPNCREEVDGHHVTYQEQHEACGHLVEPITPEEHGRIAVLEDEMRFLNKERDSYLSQALNHGITIIKLKEDMKELEAELVKVKVELNLRREQMSKFPFCPDHRDKVNGKECRECEVEHLRGLLKRLEWAGKEMTGYGGVVLCHCPACESPKGAFSHEEDCWLAAEIGGKEK